MILYRPMTPEDIPAGLALCRASGWNQTEHDWAVYFRMNPGGSQVATEEDGTVAGTVATLRYGDHFSWISMLLVDPRKCRQGIGIQLLRESLRMLSEEETIKLDATMAGRKIYVQLDFVDEYPVTRMQHPGLTPSSIPDSCARPLLEKDLPSLLELDRNVFGADRSQLLNWLHQGAPEYSFVLETNQQISGYCFGRQGHNFAHIGPVISEEADGARQLLSAGLRNCAGRPVIVDTLHHSNSWTDWLSALGFYEQRPFIRMYRGNNSHPGKPEKQFTILGPEFG
jgi:ribosomal protein S18 acetylase RimI-like enzyme